MPNRVALILLMSIIGAFDYGCFIICDSTPGTDYYFATDMTVTELAAYFKHAECEPPQASDWSMGCYYLDFIHLKLRQLAYRPSNI